MNVFWKKKKGKRILFNVYQSKSISTVKTLNLYEQLVMILYQHPKAVSVVNQVHNKKLTCLGNKTPIIVVIELFTVYCELLTIVILVANYSLAIF